MFGLGISEIITLIIVFLVVVNPKDLPKIVRKIGNIYGKFTREINQIKKSYRQFEDDMKITEIKDFENKYPKNKKIK